MIKLYISEALRWILNKSKQMSTGMWMSKMLNRGLPLSSWPWAVTSPRRRGSDEINFWQCQIFLIKLSSVLGPLAKCYWSTFSCFLPSDTVEASYLMIHDRKQTYQYSGMDSPDTKRIHLSSEWSVEHEVSDSEQSVCPILYVMSCVFIRERTLWNHCNTIEYRSVGGHTLSP